MNNSYDSFQEVSAALNLTIKQQRYELIELIHNLHKSAYGIRPRYIDFDSLSIQDMLHEVDHLAEASRHLLERESDEEYSARLFKESVDMMLVCGAGDRVTAQRWARQAANN